MECERELTDLRIKIDQLNTSIISGLKNRSRFLLNEGIFEKEFSDGMTWFLYRLKEEQDTDSKLGRFLYSEQHPIVFSKKDLAKPLIQIEKPQNGNYFDLDITNCYNYLSKYCRIL
mgnify:CR=1 FL=1